MWKCASCLLVNLNRRCFLRPTVNLNRQWSKRSLWTWGNAEFGRSGVEDPLPSSSLGADHVTPVEIKILPQNLIQQIICGGAHTVLLSASGRLLSCGLGTEGQLGQGIYENEAEFGPVEDIDNVINVSAGHWHSAAVTKSGELFTWGLNKDNQLGLIKRSDKDLPSSAFPMLVSALSGAKAIQVECGAYHTLALTADKEVYSWGLGTNGRLGHGSEDSEILPKRVEGLRGFNIVSISAGYDHSAAVSADGRLWMWGYGGWHQLGTGVKEDCLQPTLIDIETNVKQVSCGGFHSAALGHDGFLFTWGFGMYGALGHGDDTPPMIRTPCLIESNIARNIKQVSCGWKHTVVVTRLGDVLAWGHGAAGQLGMGNDHDLWAPARVPALVGRSARAVAAGFNHSAAF